MPFTLEYLRKSDDGRFEEAFKIVKEMMRRVSLSVLKEFVEGSRMRELRSE
jgi:hypothetical protein